MQAYSTIPIICPPALQLIAHFLFLFFFNDTATTEIYTLSLHDALPIFEERSFGYYLRPLHRHRLLVVLLIALALAGGLISWAILLPTLPYTAQAIVLFKYNSGQLALGGDSQSRLSADDLARQQKNVSILSYSPDVADNVLQKASASTDPSVKALAAQGSFSLRKRVDVSIQGDLLSIKAKA